MTPQRTADFDVLIVGSGPAGSHCADSLVSQGFKVGLIDIGHRDTTYGPQIPDLPFAEIRQTDSNQHQYFLGSDPKSAFNNQLRAGAHLTPPRQHMIRDSEQLFPLQSEEFFALQATSSGGLGTSWGSNCFTFSDDQLKRIGIGEESLQSYYNQVAAEIGVSGDASSDISPMISRFSPLQPPLRIDTNAASILSKYECSRLSFLEKGFALGPSPLASLTEPIADRQPNPYHDMDFWSDRRRSVYRPSFTIDKLRERPGFTYLTGRLALRFDSEAKSVRITTREVNGGRFETLSSRRLIVAAGALNTCRLVANSFRAFDIDFPLLCNRNQWIASVNLRMLGRPSSDARHSLAQITAIMKRLHATEVQDDEVIGQFYSYRSLLLFRLLKDFPLPPILALPMLRLLLTSITLINLHYSDSAFSGKRIRALSSDSGQALLKVWFRENPDRARADDSELKRFLSFLFRLGVIPLKVNRPLPGASIHYAGTIPITPEKTPLRCDPVCRLWDAPNVYAADSSSWKFLPARGLTFTVMANARRIADRVAGDLQA